MELSSGTRAPGASGLDLLVLGSGVAGLTLAVSAATLGHLRVGVLTKGELSSSATRWAQGGVAAVLGSGGEDSTDLHLADTLAAGAGLCDADAVRVLVEEGPGRVEQLIALGARFDRVAGGALDLAREGGHSTARIVHAGGAATGAEIERALVEAVTCSAAALWEGWFATSLVIESGRCKGVVALGPDGLLHEVRADNVVLATGGAGQLFAATTNPEESTGDGLAMAIRAGATVADVEFVQFHPTALHHPAMPRPLLSEALRGHGALLRDASGERFVNELSSRDIVSRAMAMKMAEQQVEHLWLDATVLEAFPDRFPTIAKSLAEAGLDPGSEWLPVAPAAHYLCGGVVTDLNGATDIPGLFACGEVACTGVHGANRLGSNSLLEGMVFGARVLEAITRRVGEHQPTGAMTPLAEGKDVPFPLLRPLEPGEVAGHLVNGGSADSESSRKHEEDAGELRRLIQERMTGDAGVVRSEASLKAAGSFLDDQARRLGRAAPSRHNWELANLVTCGRAVVTGATLRTESRGAHFREDFPVESEDKRTRIFLRAKFAPSGGQSQSRTLRSAESLGES